MRPAAHVLAMAVASLFFFGVLDAVAAGKENPVVWANTRPDPRPPRPPKQIPFPGIRDWKSLKITLSRSVCFGWCPDYTVEVRGDGTVFFEGREFVAAPGKHHGRISSGDVRKLYERFQKARFYWLYEKYSAAVTDMPTYQTEIAFDGHSKAVLDYFGTEVGMPKEVSELENQIDRITGTGKWISGSDETIAALKAEGWNFRSRDASNLELIQAAAKAGNFDPSDRKVENQTTEYLAQLLKEGVPANSFYGCMALTYSVRSLARTRLLRAAGAPLRAKKRALVSEDCDALIAAAEDPSPDVVRLFLARHPDVNRQTDQGVTALHRAAMAGSLEVVRLLLAAGANPNARGGRVKVPLHYAPVPSPVEKELRKAMRAKQP